MAAGLQVFDANGRITFDTSNRLTRYLGSVYVSDSGSITIPEFSEGVPWFYMINPLVRSPYGAPLPPYNIEMTGPNTLSWTYVSFMDKRPVTIIYGVF